MKKEITVDGIKYIRADEDRLKVGDFVRVVSEDDYQENIGKVAEVSAIEGGCEYSIELIDDDLQCEWFKVKHLQKITPEEYETEKRLLAEGWIAHVGCECPVDGDVMVEVRIPNVNYSARKACIWKWEWSRGSKITHYRIVEQKKENVYGLDGKIKGVHISKSGWRFESDKINQLEPALHTLLELMSCDGVEEKVDDKEQYFIEWGPKGLFIEHYHNVIYKIPRISPAFDTKENAQKAFDKIGKDRLMKMFLILGGKFDE